MMRILWAAIIKELRQLKRNVSLLVIIGASPLIVGLIPLSIEQQNKIRLSVVDCDNSSMSRTMIARAKASPYFAEVVEVERMEEAMDRVKGNRSDVVMIWPENMERDWVGGDAASLHIALDGTHALNAQGHLAFLEQMLQYDLPEGDVASVQQHLLFNPALDGRVWFIVSLLVLLTTLIGSCLVTLDVVSEKESGMWEQLQATPLSFRVYIVAKMVVFAMVSLFVLGVAMFLCYLLYGFTLVGPWPVFWLLVLVFLWPMLMIGIGIAALSENQVQAIYMMVFLFLTIILMSSMFSLLNAMPAWAKATRFVNPLYYMLDASRLVALRGFSWGDVTGHIAMLGAQGVGLGVFIFRRIERTKK